MATAKKAVAKKAVTKALAKKAAAKRPSRAKAKSVKVAPKALVVNRAPLDKKDKGRIALEILVNDRQFTIDTDRVAEALHSFRDEIGLLKTKMVINATFKKKTVVKVFNTAFGKRLLSNDIAAQVFEKGTKLALGING